MCLRKTKHQNYAREYSKRSFSGHYDISQQGHSWYLAHLTEEISWVFLPLSSVHRPGGTHPLPANPSGVVSPGQLPIPVYRIRRLRFEDLLNNPEQLHHVHHVFFLCPSGCPSLRGRLSKISLLQPFGTWGWITLIRANDSAAAT